MNMIVVSGRVQNDPEMCIDEDGAAYAKYALIMYRRKGGSLTRHILRCRSYGKSGDFALQELCKGIHAVCTGELVGETSPDETVFAIINKFELTARMGAKDAQKI